MLVRRLRAEDIPTLVSMGADLAIESPTYASMTYSPAKVERFLGAAAAHDPDVFVLVIEEEGVLLGFFSAYVASQLFFEEDAAWDATFYITPNYRGKAPVKILKELFDGYRQWATDLGLVSINLGVTTEIDAAKTTKLYELFGFEQFGILLRAK